MSKLYEVYRHHGKAVHVRKDLKGKHWEHCLCGDCAVFNSQDREKNCSIANMLYALCVLHDIVIPVWECPGFIKR